ncbi:uncharacterized protein LOC110831660 isoform X2 [Zootermopsis nevadensis]|uniref:uncharacterized protein LOC110831660 isoform X2 n=1 Tax=Zootermopsis nevadensis TaxID=136037 RepID=UPI000B8E8795|nr:uncharacterized protein LOC110831660 isoform X2 [Zootermopsis nevadensis]
MELTSESRKKEMSRPVEVSSHILTTTDMEITSGIKRTETSHPGDVNKCITDMELTSESRKKEMSRPVEVSSHILTTTDMEITSGIKRTETSHPGDVNKCITDMELTSESRKKEMSRPVEVSSHILTTTDMEITSGIKRTETSHPGDVNKCITDMELTSESRKKEMSRPVEVSSHILTTTDMEITSGIKRTETSHPGDVNKCITDMELTSESRKKEMSRPVEVSSHILTTTDMEITSGIKRTETSHPGDVNKCITDMELTSESRKKEMSRPVEVSSHILTTTDMEITSGIKRTETSHPGDVNKCITDMELTSESRKKEMSRPVEVSSHILTTTDMEITSGIKRTETSHPGDVNKCITDMELTSESRKKEMSRPVEVSSHILTTTDMEITSGIKRTETSHPGDVNKCITDMELTSESRKKEMSRPVEVSSHILTTTDMEITSGIKRTETSHPGDVNKCITDMELTSESRKKEMSRPVEVSSHILTTTDMEITSGIKRTETSHPGDVNKCITDMELTSESRKKEMSRPVEVSSHILTTTDMEITSGIKRTETSHPGDVNKRINTMELTSENRQNQMPAEFTTRNMGNLEFINEVRDRTFINPSTVTNLSTRDITDMKLLKVNEKGIYAQSDEFNEFASSNDMVNRHIVHHKQSDIHMETCSGTNNASGTEMRNKTHRVAFSPTSLSKEGQTEDVTDVSYHSLKSRNMKTTSNVKELHSIDSEITQHSEPIALINLSANISTDKMSPSEPSTVHALGSNTSRTTEVKKFDNISNSVYHDNKQFQNAKEYSVDNIQMFRSHEEDSFILEELGCKHEHTIKQPDLNEYAESSDLCVKADIETQKNSMESTEMEQNLHCSLLQITLTSIPDEMELSVVKNLSFETNESCEELVDRVREADEIIRESMCMTSYECAVPGNSQSAQSDSEETALLPQELNISKNPANGPVTTKQKSAKEHSEAETIANRQRCNLNGMCAKSRINQTDEKIKRKELLKDTNEVVPMSSVEEQIKAKEQRSDCLWNIKEMSDTLWSFQFLYKSLVLILKLDPCEMQDSGKLVTDIQLISHATEKADPLVKFVHNVLLQKFQIQALDSTCKTTLDVAEVLERISAEVKKTKIFVKDFIELETLDLIQINNNCVSFDIANLDIHTWFRINVKIDTWENISPADVSVENVVGNVREYEIKNLVTAATRGPNCLRDYVRIIKEYVKVLAKNKCT